MAYFELEARHADGLVTLTVRDTGRWRAPRGTNRGRGLKIIAAAVDELDLRTTDAGTEVVMHRRLRPTVSPLADVSFETLEGIVVARLEGEVDMSNAASSARRSPARVPSDARGLVLDLGGVGYVDSAGIHVFFELRERLTRRGQEIRVALAADSPVATALEYAGVQRALGAATTVRDAIEDLED